MIKGQLLWCPAPYKAGFCITDDIDGASFESVRIVYDFLKSINLYTTRAVWAELPDEPSGISKKADSYKRGINDTTVTLSDSKFLDYCKQLNKTGFEISLHGASSGNNRRPKTIRAIALMKKHFSHSNTFIFHSKNAENLYWEEKVTHIKLFQLFLRFFSQHNSYGEIEESEFFWGDICKKEVKQIRLFRTRNTNTLAFNPSMPYYDVHKPYVKSWFSATKRSLADCTTPGALRKLIRENGLTVLYQYLHRYYDGKNKILSNSFKKNVQYLKSHKEIWCDTVDTIMHRLRLYHGIFTLYRNNEIIILNTNSEDFHDLQMKISTQNNIVTHDSNISQDKGSICIKEIRAESLISIFLTENICIKGKRCYNGNGKSILKIKTPFATILVNISKKSLTRGNNTLPPYQFRITTHKNEARGIVSSISIFEEIKMIVGQTWIIIREILFKGRVLNVNKHVMEDRSNLSDNDNW